MDNYVFEAAAYMYDEQEMNRFLAPDYQAEQRPRQWMLVPRAKEIAGYKE